MFEGGGRQNLEIHNFDNFRPRWLDYFRVERVESGLAADVAGLQIGDVIICVGDVNIVKMNQDDIMDIIR